MRRVLREAGIVAVSSGIQRSAEKLGKNEYGQAENYGQRVKPAEPRKATLKTNRQDRKTSKTIRK